MNRKQKIKNICRGGALSRSNLQTRKVTAFIFMAIVTAILGAVSFAFFFAEPNVKNQTAKLETGTMKLRFADNDNGINASLNFGESVTKKFLIENNGTLEASLSLDWYELVNTYSKDSLTYSLNRVLEDGSYDEIVSSAVPVSGIPITQALINELSVPAQETYQYDLVVTLNNLDRDQTDDLNGMLNTRFNVDLPSKYRYYRLNIDPNDGVWNTYTGPQEYLMMNNDEMDLPDPTRYGYNFEGWTKVGNSSEIENNVFSMGITDTYLKAGWSPKKIKVTIDGEEQTVDFGTVIELPNPEREGYIFTGWEITGGTIDGNSLIIDSLEDITVTATRKEEKYQYIVTHNQMNLDGTTYSIVEADTEEGKEKPGTVLHPDVKVYSGFTSPTPKTLTIVEENESSPVKNRVDYKYARNKYRFNKTIDETITSEDIFYGASIDLGIPEKVGNTFTNWTINGSISSSDTITMGIEQVDAVANFKPNEYSITFNANGGIVDVESKTVTYGLTYDDLPTPTYEGFIFKGWYTQEVGGEKISSNSIVSITADVTLYVQWRTENLLVARKSGSSDEKMWEKASKITAINFEEEINPKVGTGVLEYDMSAAQDGAVMAYLVPNQGTPSEYTAYIQADGKIILNPNSSYLFGEFSLLTTVTGLNQLDTSRVTNMRGMFINSTSLVELEGLDSWNTGNVTDMSYMFDTCSSLKTLNIDNWDVTKLKSALQVLAGTSKLTSLSARDWTINGDASTSVISIMLRSTDSLKTLDLSGWNMEEVTNLTFIKNITSTNSGLTALSLNDWDISKVTDISGIFKSSNIVTLNLKNWNTTNIENISYLFSESSNLVELDLSNWNTSRVTNMSYLFQNSSKITSLDLTNWDTSSVTDMSYLFNGCTSLTTIKGLNTWETSKVTNMSGIFLECTSLISLEGLNNWKTSNVTNTSYMFSYCKSLTTLNLDGWSINSKVLTTSMFDGSKNLVSLSARNWTVDKSATGRILSIINSDYIKNVDLSNLNCSGLSDLSFVRTIVQNGVIKQLNLSNWDTSGVTDMHTLFADSALSTLDISGWDTSNVTNMKSMFSGSHYLTSIIGLNELDTSKVTNMYEMFYYCHQLTETITVRGNKCTNYDEMFLSAATASGTSIKVNYTSDNLARVQEMISTKSSNSNVSLGVLVS